MNEVTLVDTHLQILEEKFILLHFMLIFLVFIKILQLYEFWTNCYSLNFKRLTFKKNVAGIIFYIFEI